MPLLTVLKLRQERISKGKQPVGIISVRAFHQGNQTVISVSDDGAGINADYVKQKAILVGLISLEQARSFITDGSI